MAIYRRLQQPVEPREQPADFLVALPVGGLHDLLPQLGVTTPLCQRERFHRASLQTGKWRRRFAPAGRWPPARGAKSLAIGAMTNA